tara:strand:+ start:94 stop:837 length:744 start_codon:yes stop_codon:yes gene_type:complete
MFLLIPISDENPTPRKPLLTWLLIAANLLVYAYQMTLTNYGFNALINEYGVRPSVFFELTNFHTLLTSAFLHADIWHLLFNMLFLYIYGDNIESYLGRTKFLVFYVMGGVAAALLQALFSGGVDVPMIGASGCISAIMGAYWVLYPKAKINVFFWIFIFIQIIKVPASIVIGFWLLEQLISAGNGSYDGVAYFAHIGGFIFGYVGIKFFFSEYEEKSNVIRNYEEVNDQNIPISQKNKSQGLSKNDR